MVNVIPKVHGEFQSHSAKLIILTGYRPRQEEEAAQEPEISQHLSPFVERHKHGRRRALVEGRAPAATILLARDHTTVPVWWCVTSYVYYRNGQCSVNDGSVDHYDLILNLVVLRLE
jgi:hypothetical protein